MELRLLWGPGTTVAALASPPRCAFDFSSSPLPLRLLLPQNLASPGLSVTSYFVFESSLRWTSEAGPEMKIRVPVLIWKVIPGNSRKRVRL